MPLFRFQAHGLPEKPPRLLGIGVSLPGQRLQLEREIVLTVCTMSDDTRVEARRMTM